MKYAKECSVFSLTSVWWELGSISHLIPVFPFYSHFLDLKSQKRTEILRNDSNKKITKKRLEERTEKSSNTETSFWEWYIHTALPLYHQVDFHFSDWKSFEHNWTCNLLLLNVYFSSCPKAKDSCNILMSKRTIAHSVVQSTPNVRHLWCCMHGHNMPCSLAKCRT